jgi:hypothetical protein
MAQQLQDILNSLDAGYNPQRQSINAQLDKLPSQSEAQIAGLQSQKQNAFDGILNNARERGTGIAAGGIPLQEQAKYVGDNFLPAIARVKESQNNAQTSLSDALNNVNLQQRTQAYGIQGAQQDRDEAARQFDAQMAAAAQAREQAARDSAAANAGFDYSKLMGGDTPAAAPDAYADVDQQGATNAVVGLLKSNNPALIQKTISAIKASAAKGNPYDKFKLEYINSLQKNSGYGSILSKAYSYKAPKAAPPKKQTVANGLANKNPFISTLIGKKF